VRLLRRILRCLGEMVFGNLKVMFSGDDFAVSNPSAGDVERMILGKVCLA